MTRTAKIRKAHNRALVTTAAIAALALAGCGGSSKSSASHPLGDAAIQAINVAAKAGQAGATFQHPLDAVPSPDGKTLYFLASDTGGPAVFSVPAGGGTSTVVAEGAPLAQPSSVVVATNGSHVYIADPHAVASGLTGAILSARTSQSPQTPQAIPGTEGHAPRGLDIVGGGPGGPDLIYFTGVDPATNQPGLFEISAAGGTVTTLTEGGSLVAPDGVVVNAQGVAYTTDQGHGPGAGLVFRVTGGTVTPILTGVDLGSPAGVTLIENGATLAISSMNKSTQSDQLLLLDLANGKTSVASKVIGANTASSGGLHRSAGTSTAAWADVHGTVYQVHFP